MAAAVAAPAASVSQVIDDINSKYEKVGALDAGRVPPNHLLWCDARTAARCRCTRHTRTTSGPGRWLCRCTASVLQPPRSGRGSACKLQLAQRTLCVKQAARLVPSAKRATCLRVVALP